MAEAFSPSELRAIAFFRDLSDEDLTTLLDRHRLAEVMPGQTLVMEADWGENLMVVISGLAKVRSFNADGEESVLSLVGAGDLLGELSVLDGDARSADVVTLSPVRLSEIARARFPKCVGEKPEPGPGPGPPGSLSPAGSQPAFWDPTK